MSIPDQTVGKLFHYADPNLEKEFAQIYNFLQFSKYPRDSIDGKSLKLGSTPQNRLRPPLEAATLLLGDTGDLRINGAVALGGGAAATLGTIGGSGPTTAAQEDWLEVELDGVIHWIATWV